MLSALNWILAVVLAVVGIIAFIRERLLGGLVAARRSPPLHSPDLRAVPGWSSML